MTFELNLTYLTQSYSTGNLVQDIFFFTCKIVLLIFTKLFC